MREGKREYLPRPKRKRESHRPYIFTPNSLDKHTACMHARHETISWLSSAPQHPMYIYIWVYTRTFDRACVRPRFWMGGFAPPSPPSGPVTVKADFFRYLTTFVFLVSWAQITIIQNHQTAICRRNECWQEC